MLKELLKEYKKPGIFGLPAWMHLYDKHSSRKTFTTEFYYTRQDEEVNYLVADDSDGPDIRGPALFPDNVS